MVVAMECAVTKFVVIVVFVHYAFGEIYADTGGSYSEDRFQEGVTTPRHLVLYPRRLRPGTALSALALWPGAEPRSVTARLTRDGREVAADTQTLGADDSAAALLQMLVPLGSEKGQWALRVEGRRRNAGAGPSFAYETPLAFSADFLAIMVQTTRPIYAGGQLVRFRVVLLTAEVKPYEEAVDVFVVDPDGLIMRRWVSMYNNNGVISHRFRLPRLPKDGEWRIRVRAHGQTHEQPLSVHTFFKPLFEVYVHTPAYLPLNTENDLVGTVCARSDLQRISHGNVTITISARRRYSLPERRPTPTPRRPDPTSAYDSTPTSTTETPLPTAPLTLVWEHTAFLKENGCYTVSLPLELVSSALASAPDASSGRGQGAWLEGAEVRVDAAVTDSFYGETSRGFSHTRLVGAAVRVRFLGTRPLVFTPGALFEGHVVVEHEDHEPLAVSRLEASSLLVQASVHLESRGLVVLPDVVVRPLRRQRHDEDGYEDTVDDEDNEVDPREDSEGDVFNSREAAQRFRRDGVFPFRFLMPEDAERLELRATFVDGARGSVAALASVGGGAAGATVSARASAVRFHSPRRRWLHLRTSTQRAVPGEYAIFHATANFPLDAFYYLVMSKGQVLFWSEQPAASALRSVTTFAVPVSLAMTPVLRVLIVHVAPDGELVTAAAEVPLEPFTKHSMHVRMNQGKDPTKKTAEMITKGRAGAFLGLYAERGLAYRMQAGNSITITRALLAFHRLDNEGARLEHSVTWRSRDGLTPDRRDFFVAGNPGVDANTTLELAGLGVFTDAIVPRWPRTDGGCEWAMDGKGGDGSASGGRGRNDETRSGGGSYDSDDRGRDRWGERAGQQQQQQGQRGGRDQQRRRPFACFTGGCVAPEQRCDGHADCDDGSDENECPIPDDEEREYRITRISPTSDLYDIHGGDWGWREMNDEYGGEEFFRLKMPPVADDWFVIGFSVSKVDGFAAVQRPIEFSTERPFMFHLEGPSACRRGEQVALRAMLTNNMEMEMLALLEVRGADTHRFVHVEEGGIVSSYGARLEHGDHHHLVYLPPRSQQHVDIPIAPKIEQGDLSIEISATTQIAGIKHVHNMSVLAEGGVISKHTSVFLDLKNRALVLRYMAIFVDQTPLVPYQDWRRYIFGSTSGSVTVSGDVLGPIFPEIPLTVQGVMGMELKGTEASAFELANNVWTLHYLRLTNQLTPKFTRKVLEEVNVLLGEVMRRYNMEGWFQNWDTSAPSVWLTAWVIRTLKHGAFQDWEDYFYVQPEIFYNSVEWILKYQSPEGYFNETEFYYFPLDPKMRLVSGNTSNPVTLTAHVLITLFEVSQHIHGALKTVTHAANLRAVRYLEHMLSQITDPYSIAITAYALTLSGSSERDKAIRLLQNNGRKKDGLLYWSRVPIPQNEIRYENQRPFIRPREHQEGDSLAIETTAYALLALLAWDGATIDAELIVQWLNANRMSNNGFISSMDSAIGLQALTEYAFRARLLAVTDMSVTIDMPSSDFSTQIHIGNTSIGSERSMEVPEVWGHVNVIARGSGQALAQMDVSFGIDFEALVETPIVRCFELRFREFYSTFRNKSAITIESCMRWILDDPPISGAAVLELEIPTGYRLLESEAIMIAKSKTHPTLRDARTLEGKTAWYFDYIPQEWTCFNHTIRRWFPVANMTLYRQAMLYEEYAREHFVHVLVNSTPLYVLNICEVCGSYQCPYCPHYSSVMQIISSISLIASTLFIVGLNYCWRTSG